MNKWDLDACIHCGKCTRSCLFLEKYGIDLPVLKEKPELAYHCFLCGTCGCVCPKGIDGKEIALDSRRKLVEDGGGKLLDNSYDGLLLEKNPYKFANYRHSKKKAVFFTGCNFPSFFPKTTDKLVEEFAKYDVGVVYDCCGKPIEELGLVSEAAGIIERINWKLKESGVEQVIMATRHLIECGHKRIGCVAGKQSFHVTMQRLNGYKKALEESGISYDPDLVYFGDYTMESGYEAFSYILGQKVTAIFSMNDEMAFGIYRAARLYGVLIPEDISIIGFDNVPFADVMQVPLTTIGVPVIEMGKKLGEKVVELIDNKEKLKEREEILYTPRLLVRGSTKSIPPVTVI